MWIIELTLAAHAPVFHAGQIHNLHTVLVLPIVAKELLTRIYFGNLSIDRQRNLFSSLKPVDNCRDLE